MAKTLSLIYENGRRVRRRPSEVLLRRQIAWSPPSIQQCIT